jgi:hypothetical protein
MALYRSAWKHYGVAAGLHTASRLPPLLPQQGGADLVAENGGSTRMTAMSTSAIRRVVSFNNAATCLCAMRRGPRAHAGTLHRSGAGEFA